MNPGFISETNAIFVQLIEQVAELKSQRDQARQEALKAQRTLLDGCLGWSP